MAPILKSQLYDNPGYQAVLKSHYAITKLEQQWWCPLKQLTGLWARNPAHGRWVLNFIIHFMKSGLREDRLNSVFQLFFPRS